MKTVLLAGGFGTRISEESVIKPKPMLEIGGKPILWHIMKEYSFYGFNEFIVCAGYKQHIIKEWFADYYLHNSDVTFDFAGGKNDMIVHNQYCEPWKVTVDDDATIFEKAPMQRLAQDGQLMSYKHTGYWQCMDTKREMDMLEKLWTNGLAPWKKW